MLTLNFAWIGLFIFLCIAVFLFHSGFNINAFIKKDIHAKDCDTDITQDLIQKFPLVQKEYMLLPEREQNIENNQEIHEINKKLLVIQKDLDEIRRIQNGEL